MAVEVEAAGQVDEFIRVLKRRAWWIVIPFVVIGSLGTFYAVVVPKKYVSRTEIMVTDRAGGTGEMANNASKNTGVVAKHHILSPNRIRSVLDRMNWSAYEALTANEQNEFREQVRDDVSVRLESMPKESGQQLVKISYKNNRPAMATEFLSKLFLSWKNEVLQGQLRQEQNEFTHTKGLLDQVERQLQIVEERKKEIRLRNNMAPPVTGPNGVTTPPSPPVFDEYGSAKSKLGRLEAQLDEKRIELDRMTIVRDSMPPKVAREDGEEVDPSRKKIELLVQNIANIEAELESKDWLPSHRSYKLSKAQIERIRTQIRRLESQNNRNVDSEPDALVDNPERTAKTKQVEELKLDVSSLERQISALNATLDTLDAEMFRVTEAHAEYQQKEHEAQNLRVQRDALALKKNKHELQRNVLDSEEGNPFEVQLEPTIPTRPTSPNPWMISIGSIIFGLALGLGLAILKEYSKSCFRSARDLSRVMTHPVLGTVNHIRTRRERARALLVRGALGGGTLVFLLSVSYVTWAWAMNRDGLTDSLVKAIDSFRELLM